MHVRSYDCYSSKRITKTLIEIFRNYLFCPFFLLCILSVTSKKESYFRLGEIILNLLARVSSTIWIFFWPRKHEKNTFFRAKNLSVNTWRSGPDICSLICGYDPLLGWQIWGPISGQNPLGKTLHVLAVFKKMKGNSACNMYCKVSVLIRKSVFI